MENRLKVIGTWGGLIGAVVLTFGLLITAIAFVGLQGQSYSPFNHFVSELGHTAASELWGLFSAALVIGGTGFGLLMVGVGLRYEGAWRWIFLIGGLIVGISGALVGVFPMNTQSGAHSITALIFFLFSMILVALFSGYIGFGAQTVYPRWLAIIGLPMVVSALIFLVTLTVRLAENPDALIVVVDRPDFDILTTSEWGVIIFLSVWVIVLAIHDLTRRGAQTAHAAQSN